MKVVVMNAYSAANSGDGLLVDLAVQAARRNFGDGVRIDVVAADPASFHRLRGITLHDAPLMAAHGVDRLVSAARIGREYAALDRLLGDADLLFGVGGGYMRSKSAIEHMKLAAGHAWQLRHAIASGVPLVCLPQSIGPFYATERPLLGLYRKASAVFVRDNRSLRLLEGAGNTVRSPDMAVQHVAHRLRNEGLRMSSTKRVPETVCLVLRKPAAWPAAKQQRYVRNLRELVRLLSSQCRIVYGVQSTTRGNDDVRFYRESKIGGDYVALKDCLAAPQRPDMVVSVRLHGALEAVISGVPAFHISYERKGFGAYDDLRAGDWVCNGADFSPDVVINRLFSDWAAADFAASLHSGMEAIARSADEMDMVIRRLAP